MIRPLFSPVLSLVFILFSIPAIASTCQAGFDFHQIPASLSIYFVNTSSSQNDIISWNWSFGDGQTSTGQFAQHEYAHYGHYDVCLSLTDSAGCENVFCSQITVHPEYCPAPHFSYYQEPGTLLVHFIDSSFGYYIWYWDWEYGDGNSSPDHKEPNTSHLYSKAGEYEVCLTIFDAQKCPEQICQTIVVEEVKDNCQALFSYTQVEESLTLLFSDSSESPLGIVSWTWDFGDGTWSHHQNPEHTFAHPGTYTVCLTIVGIESSCYDESCFTVTVLPENPPCIALFNGHMNHEGNLVSLTNLSSGISPHTTYLWEFGDGSSSTEENPQHHYAHAGVYTICLFLSDTVMGCSAHYCHTFGYHIPWHEIDPHQQHESLPGSGIGRSMDLVNLLKYTNPAKNELNIEYKLAHQANIKLEVYDFTGKRKLLIQPGFTEEGRHVQKLNIENFNPGLYIIKLSADDFWITKNLTVSK